MYTEYVKSSSSVNIKTRAGLYTFEPGQVIQMNFISYDEMVRIMHSNSGRLDISNAQEYATWKDASIEIIHPNEQIIENNKASQETSNNVDKTNEIADALGLPPEVANTTTSEQVIENNEVSQETLDNNAGNDVNKGDNTNEAPQKTSADDAQGDNNQNKGNNLSRCPECNRVKLKKALLCKRCEKNN